MRSYFYQTFLPAKDKSILLLGGGGKSALIKRLAQDAKSLSKTSIISSVFPMPVPYESSTLISKDSDLIRKQLPTELGKYKIIFIGKKIDKNHILPFTFAELDAILKDNPADHFFIEADNTLGRSLSGYEKVDLSIPFTCDRLLNVLGADALNQRRNENWTLSKNKFLLQEEILTPNHLATWYLEHPKLLKIRKKNIPLIFFLNKVENLLVENLAIQLAKNLKLGGFDKVVLGSIFNSTLYQLK